MDIFLKIFTLSLFFVASLMGANPPSVASEPSLSQESPLSPTENDFEDFLDSEGYPDFDHTNMPPSLGNALTETDPNEEFSSDFATSEPISLGACISKFGYFRETLVRLAQEEGIHANDLFLLCDTLTLCLNSSAMQTFFDDNTGRTFYFGDHVFSIKPFNKESFKKELNGLDFTKPHEVRAFCKNLAMTMTDLYMGTSLVNGTSVSEAFDDYNHWRRIIDNIH